jgi:hypothetical protein
LLQKTQSGALGNPLFFLPWSIFLFLNMRNLWFLFYIIVFFVIVLQFP